MSHRRIRRLLQANMKFEGLDARTIINGAIKGKTNNVSEFYLNKDATSTTISDDLITTLSQIVPTARTQEAALKPLWYSSTEDGRVIMSHASTSTSTVLYDYSVVN